ncbi:MAG: phage virion morphogenesis protein [Zoogloeaceae bacterium]|jgi:phage virion morphogenesis protein|nr:phage virion morphogenesis protein [Zoogloeaceae bacterium]
MSEDIEGIEKLNATLGRFMSALSPSGQQRLLAVIARRVAAMNRQRIAANVAPDGADFEPRKPRGGKSIKRRMFARLKGTRWLKTRAFPGEAKIAFSGSAAGIARIHHYGLRGKIDKKSQREVKYPSRPLLGVSDEDASMVEDILLQNFGAQDHV